MFELFPGDYTAQDAHANLALQLPVVGLRLHAMLQPALLLGHLYVHVLGADLAAISLAKGLQNLAQGRHGLGRAFADSLPQAAGEEFTIQVPRW